jgi:CRP-like cAMP-binding protein
MEIILARLQPGKVAPHRSQMAASLFLWIRGEADMVSIEELSKVDLFAGLSNMKLERISTFCEYVEFDRGELLFREGDLAKKFFILLEGKVIIQIQLSSRPTTVSVGVINQLYQTLGWSSIVSPFFYTASGLCEENCRFIAVEGEGFVDVLEKDSEAGVVVFMRIAEVISNRLRNSRAVLLKSL